MFPASTLAKLMATGARTFNPGLPPRHPGVPLALSVTASVVLVVVPLLLFWLAAILVEAAHIANGRAGALEKPWPSAPASPPAPGGGTPGLLLDLMLADRMGMRPNGAAAHDAKDDMNALRADRS